LYYMYLKGLIVSTCVNKFDHKKTQCIFVNQKRDTGQLFK